MFVVGLLVGDGLRFGWGYVVSGGGVVCVLSSVVASWVSSVFSSFITRATATSLSPWSRRISLTPWVFRPRSLSWSRPVRISIPLAEINMRSSSGFTAFSATTFPFLSYFVPSFFQ